MHKFSIIIVRWQIEDSIRIFIVYLTQERIKSFYIKFDIPFLNSNPYILIIGANKELIINKLAYKVSYLFSQFVFFLREPEKKRKDNKMDSQKVTLL